MNGLPVPATTRTLIVINVGTEHALDADLASPQPLAKSAWRSAWLASEGDVLLSPVPIDADFLRYVGDTLGFDSESLTVVTRPRPLTDNVLLESGLVEELRSCIEDPASFSAMSCFSTEGTARLAAAVGIEDTGREFATQGGGQLLNRKSHFRQLAVGAGLPLAEGSVIHSPRALVRAIESHLPDTGTVIVKKDDGAGGMGNITLTRGTPEPLPGSSETRRVDGDVRPVADRLWEELTDPRNPVLVVESYHRASHMFYFEYSIEQTGLPRFLDSGTLRLSHEPLSGSEALLWIGLDIPAEVPAFSLASALGLSARFVALTAQLGYRGHINVDAITTESGELIFNEVNGRWGGGLVMHAIAERLLGPRYADTHVLSSLRNVESPPRPEALHTLESHGLRYDHDAKEGIVILACHEAIAGPMEYLVIARSRSRARELESVLRDVLARDASAGGR